MDASKIRSRRHRAELYREIRVILDEADRPLSTTEITEQHRLKRSSINENLKRMRDRDLIEKAFDRSGEYYYRRTDGYDTL